MAQGLHLILTIFCVHLICVSSQQETGFIYKGSSETDHGDAKGLLQLTDGSRLKMGHTFNSNRSLFSTQFVCALVSKAGFVCGHHTALLVQAVVLPTIIMYLALGAFFVYVRRRYAKLSEEWEKEFNGPRRSTYKSLYMATKGFKKTCQKKRFRRSKQRNSDRDKKRKKKKGEEESKLNQLSRTMWKLFVGFFLNLPTIRLSLTDMVICIQLIFEAVTEEYLCHFIQLLCTTCLCVSVFPFFHFCAMENP